MRSRRSGNFSLLLSFLTVLLCCSAFSPSEERRVLQAAAAIPVQHEGRIKPLDSFARETLNLVAGKTTLQRRPALRFLLDALTGKTELLDETCIRIENVDLKKMLGLPGEEKYFSYNQLKNDFPAFIGLVQSAKARRDQDQRPSALELGAELLYTRLMTVDHLKAGDTVKVIPVDGEREWVAPGQTTDAAADQFQQLMAAYAAGKSGDFVRMATEWKQKVNPYLSGADVDKIEKEVLYYKIHPFFYAWVLYVVSFALLSWGGVYAAVRGFGFLLVGAAMLFHSWGLLWRILILGRPPVSNMFESIIFMSWVLMICAGIYYALRRNVFVLSSGALASGVVMIYANLLPIEQSLSVLVPVLRSNYWLTIHVLTIVASYGIFGLAMALGHRHLFLDARNRFTTDTEKASADVILRLMQAGLITLGIGTILGGVWANESWGRFWGWDPKETWALITFLGYMVVVHLRVTHNLDNFALAVSAIVNFFLVLMTWYGVNFLLGRGLHSYGFGSGGTIWIGYYLGFEFVFLSAVVLRKTSTKFLSS